VTVRGIEYAAPLPWAEPTDLGHKRFNAEPPARPEVRCCVAEAADLLGLCQQIRDGVEAGQTEPLR
jgi:hypothetical protein